jgi:hypothetical protein
MIRFSSLPFASLFLLAACSHPVPRVTIIALDTSLSITPRAVHAAQIAIADQISQLGRGDRIVLIPITGDAQNDTGGRILRLVAPTERQAYDNDLRKFQEDAKKRYDNWLASLDQHQTRTDILGSLEVAWQEFAVSPKNADRRLIVLSDFLEDDPSYRFVSSPQIANADRARAFAVILRTGQKFSIPGVPVCFGRLESSEFSQLSPKRKKAVEVFWTEYLNDRGQAPVLRFDGTGMLSGGVGCDESRNDALLNRTEKGKESNE